MTDDLNATVRPGRAMSMVKIITIALPGIDEIDVFPEATIMIARDQHNLAELPQFL